MSVDPSQALIRGLLSRDALRLGAGRALPLDLATVLSEFRIRLEPTTAVGHSPHGHLRRTSDGWRIGVDPEATLPRQRFTIAHELGHYLVAARLGFRPGSVRDYWMLEAECQAFAAAVLAPPEAVAAALTPAPDSAAEVAAAIDRLAADTGLALEAAARRIVEVLDRPQLVVAFDGPDGWRVGHGQARVAWAYANRGGPPARRGERIRRGHLLADHERAVKALRVGEARPVTLDSGLDAWIERRGPAFAWLVGPWPASAGAS